MNKLTTILGIIALGTPLCLVQTVGHVPPPRRDSIAAKAVVPPPPARVQVQKDTESKIQKLVTPKYKVISYPTPNVDTTRVNEVKGVILHHTAEPTAQRSLEVLTSKRRGVGTHVVIDTDGTRYVMCEPHVVTFHAGNSILNGREGCNGFTVGIEFQGNTLVEPLTQDQIDSAVEYLLPIIKEYNVPIGNIVTHEMVRQAYKRRYPRRRCYSKVDITPTEYQRVITALKARLQ